MYRGNYIESSIMHCAVQESSVFCVSDPFSPCLFHEIPYTRSSTVSTDTFCIWHIYISAVPIVGVGKERHTNWS